MAIDSGIYKKIITTLFEEKLKTIDAKNFFIGKRKISKKEAITLLSNHLFSIITCIFTSIQDGDEENAVDKCIEFTNNTIKAFVQEFNFPDNKIDLSEVQSDVLSYIIDKSRCDYADIEDYIKGITPLTSMVSTTLFTGGNDSISMVSELKKEILSSDEICLVVSFIKESGLNSLLPELKEFTKTGKLRVITTTYIGATDYKAIQKLSLLPNTKVKISYNEKFDRLHAKGYIFLRKTGLNTAYIGSSNISAPALKKGLEWNLKVSQIELPYILKNIRDAFESYWADETFEYFRPGIDDDRLKKALNYETSNPINYSLLDLIREKDFQKEILERLDVERNIHGHFRNLIVAATGTGKTVIAAFDFKRFVEANPDHHNLLFIVHREEILKQACATFQQILSDYNFGEIWYGQNSDVKSYKYLFASKDMLNSRFESLNLPEDYYDYIVIDEVHHSPAESYQNILSYFKPKILLGLTATPERSDGQDITVNFDNHISAEIRLPEALNAKLLCPFKYYGITDCVDLEDVRWERGHFVASELTKVYTINDSRTRLILESIEKYLTDYNKVRALCFCVSKEHANFMNAKFTLAGLKSGVLTSDSSNQERTLLREKLRKGSINYLFVVDIFNEGVDIPEIDTVIFLRPTESATIFLQQFGRGLRLCEGKDHLTVLDFVGHSRAEFSYQDRFRAIIGKTSMSIKEELEHGFPHMPLDCQIELEEKAKEYILQNIKAFTNSTSQIKIINLLKNFSSLYNTELNIKNFLHSTGIPFEKVFKDNTWSELCYKANLTATISSHSKELKYAINKKWLSTDSYSYFSFLRQLSEKRFNVIYNEMTIIEQKRALMLYYDLYDQGGAYECIQDMFNDLATDDCFIDEFYQIVSLLADYCEADEKEDNSFMKDRMPLKLHGIYTKAQIQVAIETSSISKKSSSREGVERNKNLKLEAMYVDIIKDREAGSTTNYNDFAISRNTFNWETQNSVSQESVIGKKYISKENNMLLFVRKQATASDNKSRTLGYVYMGQVDLMNYSGNNPMNIIWQLKTPMSESTYSFAAIRKAIG